jgi:hypothetical protein
VRISQHLCRIGVAAAVVMCVRPAAAQAPPAQAKTPLIHLIETVAQEIATKKATNPKATLSEHEVDLFAMRVVQQRSLGRLLQEFEEQRADEQIGATSSSSGTTTLVSQGTVPEILAFAVENGAITRSQSGTALTFRGNLGGVFDAAAKKGFVQMMDHGGDPGRDLLKRLSFSATFDASRGSAAGTTTFTGNQQQLSQWSARAQIVNRRDPLRAEYRTSWLNVTKGPLADVSQAAGALDKALTVDPAFQSWFTETKQVIGDVSATEILAKLSAQMEKFPVAMLSDASQRALADYDRTTSAFVRARQDVLHEISNGAQAALEFTSDRPLHGPATSSYRLVVAVGGTAQLTGNASVTLFDTIPSGVTNRVRDYQLSGEIDVKLGAVDSVGPFVLSFAGKFVNQLENSYDEAGAMVPDTKGTTAVGQLKLTIPVKGSGVRIPFSLTFANRTDLIKESIVRANVGLTYDLDTIFSKLKP